MTDARDDLVERLNGQYRIPINDGLGPAGGEEPNNPNEFVRTFPTTPIMREAATRIQQLTARVEAAEASLAEAERVMALPRDGDDYPLWLLIAVKKSLFRVCEDPTLEDARAILGKIDAAITDQGGQCRALQEGKSG